MQVLFGFIVRLLLIAAGAIFTLSVALAFTLAASLWLLRSTLAKLTGRRAPRFEMRYRTRTVASRTPRADAVRPLRGSPDIIDVEPK